MKETLQELKAKREALDKQIAEMEAKEKSGMYGEMPKIKIGKYSISDMYDTEDCTTVWIEDTEKGEGGQFCKTSLKDVIGKFYKEYF